MKKQPRYYSESFKLGVIKKVLSGAMSKEEARVHYGIGGNSAILNWMRKFGLQEPISKPTSMKKSTSRESPDDYQALKAELKATQELLEQQKVRAELYSTMIDLAEQKYGIPIRKKSDAKP